MKPPLPPEAYSLADRFHLGIPIRVYKTPKYLIEFLGSFLILLFSTIVMTNKDYGLVQHSSPWFALTFIFPALCYLILLVFLRPITGIVFGLLLRVRAYFCQEGFVYLEGKKVLVVRWEQIEQVSMRKKFIRWLYLFRVTYVVLLKDGSEVFLSALAGVDWELRIRRQLRKYHRQKQ